MQYLNLKTDKYWLKLPISNQHSLQLAQLWISQSQFTGHGFAADHVAADPVELRQVKRMIRQLLVQSPSLLLLLLEAKTHSNSTNMNLCNLVCTDLIEMLSTNCGPGSASRESDCTKQLAQRAKQYFRVLAEYQQGKLRWKDLVNQWVRLLVQFEGTLSSKDAASYFRSHKSWLQKLLRHKDSSLRSGRHSFKQLARQYRQQPAETLGEDSLCLVKLASQLKLATANRNQLEDMKLAALKEFAYGASHEINNPLANIASRAQLLLRDEQHPDRRQRLAMIEQQAMRAHEMISNAMYYAHPPQPQFENVDLVELLDRLVSDNRWSAKLQKTSLSLKCSDPVVKANVDPAQFEFALDSLIQNSFQSLGAGGTVTVGLKQAENQTLIEIVDDGPGFSSRELEHKFDPFFSGREAGRGLGFGLSRCYRILELHNGSVLLKNRRKGGAKITLVLPGSSSNLVAGDKNNGEDCSSFDNLKNSAA